MKTIIQHLFLLLSFVLISMNFYAQQKEIKVQIMHENKVIIDTTLYKTSDEAKLIIENLVQGFTTDPVTIDTKLTHGLYVFNIKNDSWIDSDIGKPQKAVSEKNTPPEVEVTKEPTIEKPELKVENTTQTSNFDDIELDSLYLEFSKELDTHWNEAHIDIIVDSVGSSFNEIWNEVKKGNFQNNSEIEHLKDDFEYIFEKIKTTQIMIIQDRDTLKID